MNSWAWSTCCKRHAIYLDRRFTLIQRFFSDFGQPDIFTLDFDKDEVLGHTIKLETHTASTNYERVSTAVSGRSGFTAHLDNDGTYNAFEIYSPTISKAVGMRAVLEHYGIDVEESYAFGDGVNDVEMIRYAGHGIAMGNACDELKEAADEVCGPVTEDGLAHYLATIR